MTARDLLHTLNSKFNQYHNLINTWNHATRKLHLLSTHIMSR